MNRIIENCRRLCAAPGVPGDEGQAAQAAAELLRAYLPDAHTDGFGSAVGMLPSKNPDAKTLLLDAHIDEIGLIILAVDDRGFLKFDKCGGVDRRLLPAQRVIVHGRKALPGVIGSKPPHLQSKEDANKAADFNDLFIDVGLSKERADALVSPGDRVTFVSVFDELENGRVSCKALDDRAGCASILEALELLKGEELPVHLAVQFSGREETGGQGAAIAAFNQNPDAAIAVDVSFAKFPGFDDPNAGELGKGVMIGFAAALDKRLCDALVSIAKEQDIPWQYEGMGGRSTGTNADEIAVSRGGVRCALLSVPQRFMHMPSEVVQVSDIAAVGRLMAEFIRKAGELL